MSTFNILTKIFPFLSLFILLGCPSYNDLSFNETDNMIKAEENVTEATEEAKDAVMETTEDYDSNTVMEREELMKNSLVWLDSINALLNWKLVNDNLYKNNKGELGFQIDYVTEFGSTKNYISRFCGRDSTLNQVIDAETFKHLGSTFYKDKNNIYHYFDMAYGGKFSIYEVADYNTFNVLGDHYAKDKNNIYGERAGVLENVDYATFTSEKNIGPYAKDKNGYYFWDDFVMTHDEFYKKYKRKSVSLKEFSELIKN